jgi:hypothetical protein
MPTKLSTAEGRRAAIELDRTRHLARIDREMLARLRELAAEHGLDIADEAALTRLGAEDAAMQELSLRRLVIERVGPVLTDAGYVPVIGDDGEIGWRHQEDA